MGILCSPVMRPSRTCRREIKKESTNRTQTRDEDILIHEKSYLITAYVCKSFCKLEGKKRALTHSMSRFTIIPISSGTLPVKWLDDKFLAKTTVNLWATELEFSEYREKTVYLTLYVPFEIRLNIRSTTYRRVRLVSCWSSGEILPLSWFPCTFLIITHNHLNEHVSMMQAQNLVFA